MDATFFDPHYRLPFVGNLNYEATYLSAPLFGYINCEAWRNLTPPFTRAEPARILAQTVLTFEEFADEAQELPCAARD